MDEPTTAPWYHWAADDFQLQRCHACATFQHPPGHLCAQCHSSDLGWAEAERSGAVISWSVVHRAPLPQFTDLTPYTIALVQLTSGPLMELWFVSPDGPPEIGQAVRIVLDDVVGRRLPVAFPAQA